MDWYAFSKEVHQNAVEHGFWEGERPIDEVFALIHSEWSEAMEAYRKDEPMVWYDEERGHKPEGIAVELVDGCIRIFDYLAFLGNTDYFDTTTTYSYIAQAIAPFDDDISMPSLVCILHRATAEAANERVVNGNQEQSIAWLRTALGIACGWLARNKQDFEAIMCEKHAYNKTRPYKHGKKC